MSEYKDGQGAEGPSSYVGKHRKPHELLHPIQFAAHQDDDSIDDDYYTSSSGKNEWRDY